MSKTSIDYYKVNVKQFLKICKYVTKIRVPILVRGRHGIGKSEIIAQFAESIGYKMIDRRASQMSEGDLCGIPSIKDGATVFNPPDWFAECCKHPRLLFLDELDRASKEIEQSFFELGDSRKIFGHELHPDTLVFAAINGGNSDNMNYFTSEWDAAALDRWTVIDFDPTVDEWLEWAQQLDKNGVENILPVIRDYISVKPGTLEFIGNSPAGKVTPSRRSWARFSKCLVGEDDLLEDRMMLSALGSGYVGAEIAMGFADYALNYKTRLSPEDIMLGNQWEKTKKFSSREHLQLFQEFEAWKRFLSPDFKDSHYQNLWNYVKTLGSELFMKFHDVLKESSPEVWHELIRVTNEEIVNLYTSYLGGKVDLEEDSTKFDWDLLNR